MITNADIAADDRSRATIWSRLKVIAPITISSIALALSLFSLFLSQLQPARIQVHSSEFAYLKTAPDDLLRLNLYLTFTNNGARLGVVRKVAVLLQPPGKSDGYILQAAYFDRLDVKGDITWESVIGPIPVDGHNTVSRQIRFLSARDRPGDYRALLVRGEYRATVLVWTSTDTRPTITIPFSFMLSDRDLEDLGAQRLGKQTEYVELQHKDYQRWNPRAINEQEARHLLSEDQ